MIHSNIYNYAFDINKFIDEDDILQNFNKYEFVETFDGFTSKVHVLEYNNSKIIKKIYKNRDINNEHYVDNSFIKESFYNEIKALIIFKNETTFSKNTCN